MSTLRGWERSLLLLLGAVVLGCPLHLLPGVPHVPALADCPGPLVSTDEIAGSFVLRQDMRLRAPELDVGVRVIVQKTDARLVLVGFNTLGFKVFSVVQEGTDVTVDAPLGPAWGVPPLNVLRDVHRSRFLRVPGGPFPDGDVQATRRGLLITEQWRDGTVVRRSLKPVDGGGSEPAQATEVTFDADVVTITHRGCGYEATLVTAEERALDHRQEHAPDVRRRDPD